MKLVSGKGEVARRGQKCAAEDMIQVIKRNCNRAEVGDSIFLGIPSEVDRGPLNPRNILGRVLKTEVNQMGTNHDILKNWFSRNHFIISGSKFSRGILERLISYSARQWPCSQNLGGKGTPAIIALLKSNTKRRDVPALKSTRYAIYDVTEEMLVQTNKLIIRCFP